MAGCRWCQLTRCIQAVIRTSRRTYDDKRTIFVYADGCGMSDIFSDTSTALLTLRASTQSDDETRRSASAPHQGTDRAMGPLCTVLFGVRRVRWRLTHRTCWQGHSLQRQATTLLTVTTWDAPSASSLHVAPSPSLSAGPRNNPAIERRCSAAFLAVYLCVCLLSRKRT